VARYCRAKASTSTACRFPPTIGLDVFLTASSAAWRLSRRPPDPTISERGAAQADPTAGAIAGNLMDPRGVCRLSDADAGDEDFGAADITASSGTK
jgi:hypothetical protein